MDADSDYRLVRRALSRMMRSEPAYADDMVQQAMLVLFEKREQLDGADDALRARYAQTAVTDYMRKLGIWQRRERKQVRKFISMPDDHVSTECRLLRDPYHLERDDYQDAPLPLPVMAKERNLHEDPTFDWMVCQDRKRRILGYLRKRPQGRAILWLRNRGWKLREIAEMLGMTESGVCWRLRRARQA